MGARQEQSKRRQSKGRRARLVERELELRVLAQRLRRAIACDGGVVYVESPAGTGKSALLAAAAQIARRSRIRVLEARGGPLERDLAFGVALALFEREWLELDSGERAHLLNGPTRGIEELMGSPPDEEDLSGGRRHLLIHGLMRFATRLATTTPRRGEGSALALLVDDVHWADSASLRFLGYMAARIRTLPIALIVAARSGEPVPDQPELDFLRQSAGDAVLHPRDLSPEGVEAVTRAQFDGAAESFVAECARLSGGNPLLLAELLAEVARTGGGAGERAAGQLGGLIPETLQHLVRSRIARLPREAVPVALSLAVLGDGAALETAAVVAGLDFEATSLGADALAGAGLLRSGVPLSFAQPLVGAVVEASMSTVQRVQLHRRSAAALRDRGAPAERIARHLWRRCRTAIDTRSTRCDERLRPR